MVAAPTGPRVRFAPSPTGYFHVGGARTALYNWLFARQHDGTFVLRIEDTDRDRSDPAWTEGILNALQWLGLGWDEGPYRQSERREGYEAAVGQLIAGGFVYYCDCTSEEVQRRTKGNPIPGYDGHCRERELSAGPGRALRFRVPDAGTTVVHDLVRGDVEFANATIEDFIIVKSNGDPLFVLASVVDDMAMRITHVIRGEEHLPTTPKALLLWAALEGPDLPLYAHLPVLVNERRQKLSKRRDRVAVEDYRSMGYLPEAMVNYLALVGWGPGDEREEFSLDDLIGAFRLEDVNKSPAFFDEKRLLHFNGLYLRGLDGERFIELSLPFIERERTRWAEGAFDLAVYRQVAPLVQARIGVLAEVPEYIEFLFAEPFTPDPDAVAKAITGDEGAAHIIELARAGFADVEWSAAAIREVVEGIGETLGRKLARTQAPLRVATMGRTVGLPLFESLEVLGRERTLERLERAQPLMFFFLKPIKWAFKLVSLALFAAVVFVIVCAVGVVRAESGTSAPSGAAAIVVTGSAVVGTAPSADLLGRLLAALALYRANAAPLVIAAGPGPSATQPGVPTVAGDWLKAEGVNGNSSSLEEIATSNATEFAAVAGFLGKGRSIIVVTDAVDAKWALNAAAAAGLHASASIVAGTKKLFVTDLGPLAREASGVAAGHLIGPQHAVWAAS